MARADEKRSCGLQNARRFARMVGEMGGDSRRANRRAEARHADATADGYEADGRGIGANVTAWTVEAPISPARVSIGILKISGSST